MNQRILLNRAISKSGGVVPGTEFLLKDLFDGVDWSNMKVGERLNFGRTFKAEVLAGNIPFVSYIGKAQNNSAKYKKER